MLYSRVTTNSIETTVVVGEYKTIRRYYYTRAIATEVDDSILDSIVTLIQLLHRQLEAILLHLLIDGCRQVVKCPHTFIGMSTKGAKTHQG